LSALSATVEQESASRTVAEHHLYLDWYALLLDVFGDNAETIYSAVAEGGAYANVGDFIFAANVFPDTVSLRDEFSSAWTSDAIDTSQLGKLQDLAIDFVSLQARRLADVIPDDGLVGLSSTFTQTVPSLSLSIALVALRPDVSVVLGGANMNPERAELLLRNFACLDFVAFGEGEATLANLLEFVGNPTVPNPDLRGLGRRTAQDGLIIEDTRPSIDLDLWPVPDATSYFDQLATTGLDAEIEPKLAYEIGRGCWWGENGIALSVASMVRRWPFENAKDERSPTTLKRMSSTMRCWTSSLPTTFCTLTALRPFLAISLTPGISACTWRLRLT